MLFCKDCGAQLEEGQVCSCKQQTRQQQESQQVNQQPVYQQQAYQQPQMYNNQTNLEEPVTVGEWLVTWLLLLIPCVNIVLMFVWAFSSSQKKSKSNFFKAYLILMLIVIVIYILVLVIFGATIFSMLPKRGYTYY